MNLRELSFSLRQRSLKGNAALLRKSAKKLRPKPIGCEDSKRQALRCQSMKLLRKRSWRLKEQKMMNLRSKFWPPKKTSKNKTNHLGGPKVTHYTKLRFS